MSNRGPKFNPPPGWPKPPTDWTPPKGWTPEPSWPEPPPGWQLWLPQAVEGEEGEPSGEPDTALQSQTDFDSPVEAADPPVDIDHRIAFLGLRAGFFEPIGIALAVAEFQRVVRHIRQFQPCVDPFVEQDGKTQVSGNPQMVVAVLANMQVLIQIAMKEVQQELGIRFTSQFRLLTRCDSS